MPCPRKLDQTCSPGFFSCRLNKTPLPISLNREKSTGPHNLNSLKLTSDATNPTPKASQSRLRKFMEEIQESKLNPDKKNFTQTTLSKSIVKHQRNYGHTRDPSYHSLEPVNLFVSQKILEEPWPIAIFDKWRFQRFRFRAPDRDPFYKKRNNQYGLDRAWVPRSDQWTGEFTGWVF